VCGFFQKTKKARRNLFFLAFLRLPYVTVVVSYSVVASVKRNFWLYAMCACTESGTEFAKKLWGSNLYYLRFNYVIMFIQP